MIHPFNSVIIQQMRNPPVAFVPRLPIDKAQCSVCKTEFGPQDNWRNPLLHAPDCRWRAMVMPYWLLSQLADQAPAHYAEDLFYFGCIYCGLIFLEGEDGHDESLHAPTCPWRLAVEYMAEAWP